MEEETDKKNTSGTKTTEKCAFNFVFYWVLKQKVIIIDSPPKLTELKMLFINDFVFIKTP